MLIPIYKLYYSQIKDPGFLDILTYKLLSTEIKPLRKLASYIEKIRYRKIIKLGEKFTGSHDADTGISLKSQYLTERNPEVLQVHKTVPYSVYRITLANGVHLDCADFHLIFSKNPFGLEGWRPADRLKPTVQVLFDGTWVFVDSVECLGYSEPMFDVSVDSYDKSYETNGILSHNTTTIGAMLLHKTLFSFDKNCLVAANKKSTAVEILSKIKEFMEGLPFFMKPGIVQMRNDRITFENGCTIKCAATSKTPATGDSLQLLYVDEAAVIASNIIEEFWASIQPTMSSFRGSQIILSSTPRGKGNLFHRLYEGALNGTNEFKASRVDWWEVPGRGPEWEAAQRLEIGDEMFNREYGLSFETNASRLISAYYIKFTQRIKRTFVTRELYGVPKDISDKIMWHPDFDPEDFTYYSLLKRRFLFVVDTAEGIEKGTAGKKDSDYNVINIFELSTLSPSRVDRNRNYSKNITVADIMSFRQVGLYVDNLKDEEECVRAAKYLAFNVFKTGYQDIDSVRILIEMNFNGKNWVNLFKGHPGYYDQIIIKCPRGQSAEDNPKLDYGFKTTGGKHGKNYFCELGAKLMDKLQIIVSQENEGCHNKSTLHQLAQFGKNSKGAYEGSCIHDDISVTCLFASIALEQRSFTEWCEEWLESQEQTPKIQKLQQMLEMYVETEPTVSDEEFSKFFQMASGHLGGGIRQPQNTYSQIGNSSSGSSPYQPMRQPMSPYRQKLSYPKRYPGSR